MSDQLQYFTVSYANKLIAEIKLACCTPAVRTQG